MGQKRERICGATQIGEKNARLSRVQAAESAAKYTLY